jgi:hypothetical protein
VWRKQVELALGQPRVAADFFGASVHKLALEVATATVQCEMNIVQKHSRSSGPANSGPDIVYGPDLY